MRNAFSTYLNAKLRMMSVDLSNYEKQLFRIKVHALTLVQACEAIFSWIQSANGACRYVVTPNVDHIVQLQSNSDLRAAYDSASMVVADGWPIVLASWLLMSPLPERVAGSDLVPALMLRWCASTRLRVFLLGAAPGVADTAARAISLRYTFVEVCGTYSPPFEFEKDEAENERIINIVNDCTPDLIIIGFGAPKQEIWLKRYAHFLNAKVAIAAGGTIDFLAGVQCRAPLWMRRAGLEWLHRFLTNPRRLWKRYLVDASIFPFLVAHECIRNLGISGSRRG
jgi:N-acetylglucosaminyldiphosphoundecaprenol N-acetyl-beta-D-mannosaminyltransferase